MENDKINACPVCGTETQQDEIIVYCEDCGFNIKKREETTKQTEA